MQKCDEHMELSGSSHWGKKESEKRVRGLLGVVELYRGGVGEEKRKIIISVQYCYVLSESQGRQFTAHQCCLWTLNCVRSRHGYLPKSLVKLH